MKSKYTRHGQYYSGTYKSWRSMRDRCLNPNNSRFEHYGGRGILVCERWTQFTQFHEDMGDRPEGYTIERIDVNGNYEPGNCLWIPRSQQTYNRRYNKVLEYRGEKKTLAEWARSLGIPARTVQSRHKKGFSVEEILSVSHLKPGP